MGSGGSRRIGSSASSSSGSAASSRGGGGGRITSGGSQGSGTGHQLPLISRQSSPPASPSFLPSLTTGGGGSTNGLEPTSTSSKVPELVSALSQCETRGLRQKAIEAELRESVRLLSRQLETLEQRVRFLEPSSKDAEWENHQQQGQGRQSPQGRPLNTQFNPAPIVRGPCEYGAADGIVAPGSLDRRHSVSCPNLSAA